MNRKYILILLAAVLAAVSCRNGQKKDEVKENLEAKEMLQGIWVNEETQDPVLQVKGDTIYYADSTSVPVYFCVLGDSLVVRGSRELRYPILKQAPHVFFFANQNGDEVHLIKSESPKEDEGDFKKMPPRPINQGKVIKRDTVVFTDNERYHLYVQVNPTTYKVYKVAYNDDGVEVENVYLDNTVHVSVFHGASKVYSRDFNKKMFSKQVPESFLKQAVLTDVEFGVVDAEGFHFNAVIVTPDDPTNYLVQILITRKGRMSLSLK